MDDLRFTSIATIAVLGLMLCGWVFFSYQEAQAFNRLTRSHVTTWDAMWVDLRVIESPKK